MYLKNIIHNISFEFWNCRSIINNFIRIGIFFAGYHNSSLLLDDGRNQQICNYDALPHEKKVCMFDVDTLGPCSFGQGYGFATSNPCIFLKLNKVIINIALINCNYSSQESKNLTVAE